MQPVDVLTDHTLAYVLRSLPRHARRVLEVGAGAGHLAQALTDAGLQVVAIDASERAVSRARDLHHEVRHADWHTFEDGAPFDAILFSRSLHHIDRLDEALDRCWPQLAEGGRVILEEFSAADMDERTAAWMREQAELLRDTEALFVARESVLGALLEAPDPHVWWHDRHDHLHAEVAMRAAAERLGRIVEKAAVPYLYRYFVGDAEGEEGARLVGGLLEAETALIERDAICAIGRRFVAAPA